jgi:trk system potassium uptake protein TrkH
LAFLALSFVELGFEPYTQSSRQFIEIFFEVVSAFASCGLSTGITPRLSWLGKLILILVMFVGRFQAAHPALFYNPGVRK